MEGEKEEENGKENGAIRERAETVHYTQENRYPLLHVTTFVA